MGRPVRIVNELGVTLIVGTTDGAFFDYSTADPELHRYHANPGWAKDTAALREAEQRGCIWYRVLVTDDGRPRRILAVDKARIDAMFTYGRAIHYEGHRAQIQLPFDSGRWERRVVNPTYATPPKPETNEQLALGLDVEAVAGDARGLH